MCTTDHRRLSNSWRLLASTAFALLLLGASPVAAQSSGYGNGYSNTYDDYGAGSYGTETYEYEDGSSYSYARVVEGSVTLIEANGDRETLGINQPVLVGDRLWLPHGSRLEIALSDRNLLRLEGEAEVIFDAIAYSAASNDRETILRLLDGEAQLVVPRDALGKALPRIETTTATVYVHEHGNYRIEAHGRNHATLTVREGLAEMVGDRGNLLVHAGEMGWAEGGGYGRLERAAAGRTSSLERWGDRLTYAAYESYDDIPYVDESLRYAAAPLARHGAWIEVGSRRVWRPTVRVSWRPYHHGYWRQTPVGLTWVSSDPWGYVTHHYGSWDYHDHHGWVWYPGRHYSPARVTWYWGPSYVGWCPTGYYESYYRRHHRSGFRISFGIFGTAGGHWNHFSHWSFTATVDFGHYRHRKPHIYTGPQLAYRHHRLEEGIITGHGGFNYRGGAQETYAHLRDRVNRNPSRHLDVSDFVARKPLDENVANVVLKPEKPTRTEAAAPTLARRPATPGARGEGRPNATTPTRTRGENGAATTKPGRVALEDARGTARGGTDRGDDTRPNRGRDSWYPTKPDRGSATQAERPRTVTPPRSAERPRTVTPPRSNERPRTITPPRSSERPRTVTPPRSNERPRTVTPPRSNERPRTVTPPRSSNRPRTVTPPRSSERPRTVTPPRSSNRPRTVTPPRSNERPRASTPPRSSNRPRASSPPRSNQRPRASSPPRSNERPRASSPPRSHNRPRADRPSNNRSNDRANNGSSNARRNNKKKDRDDG